MSRLAALARRYAASASIARNGVDIIVAADADGRSFDQALRDLLAEVREDGPGPWDDLVAISKALRWRRLTQPQPIEFNLTLAEGHAELFREIGKLRGAVLFDRALARLEVASAALVTTDSPVGGLLARSIDEVGASACAVVCASRAAQAGVRDWLGSRVRILVAGELEDADGANLVYVIGPPLFYPPSIVTAPPTDEVVFLVPGWFKDLSLPRSVISAYAEGAPRIRARVAREGDDGPASSSFEATAEEVDESELQPTPVWQPIRRPDRAPDVSEVEARKLLLAGDLALWLDDGDRIRAVDPRQPAGERVTYVDVDEVGVGTFLLVRTGVTERSVLYDAALERLGSLGPPVDQTQRAWKRYLHERIRAHGYRGVVRALKGLGVRAADRARAWTDPNLIRPNSDMDFVLTLGWLGVPIEPTLSYANRLRRALYGASADIREELESAVSRADLDQLQRQGSLNLEVETAGFRGILATRVLAVSPTTAIIQRRDARIPFPDRSGRWLE